MASWITKSEANECVVYDAETGAFAWRGPKQGRRLEQRPDSIGPRGYRRIFINGRYHQAHRVAWLLMTGDWPSCAIDHVNGDRLDNRFGNLRLVTASQNAANSVRRSNNKSGLKGVIPVGSRFRAAIKKDGKHYDLGSFETAERAHRAYKLAAKVLFGKFARAA